MKVHKSSDLKTFYKLTKKRQKAVILLFDNKKTINEIAEELNITDRAIYKWKNDSIFVQAQQEYAIYVLNNALPESINELMGLIKHGKSEMVKLQAIQTVLKHANLLSDNSTPELDKARIRKANADARKTLAEAQLREAQLKAIEESDDPSNKTIIVDDIREVSDDSNSETKSRD